MFLRCLLAEIDEDRGVDPATRGVRKRRLKPSTPPGSAKAFQPRGDVHSIAVENIVPLDQESAEIDADAIGDPLLASGISALRSTMSF